MLETEILYMMLHKPASTHALIARVITSHKTTELYHINLLAHKEVSQVFVSGPTMSIYLWVFVIYYVNIIPYVPYAMSNLTHRVTLYSVFKWKWWWQLRENIQKYSEEKSRGKFQKHSSTLQSWEKIFSEERILSLVKEEALVHLTMPHSSTLLYYCEFGINIFIYNYIFLSIFI